MGYLISLIFSLLFISCGVHQDPFIVNLQKFTSSSSPAVGSSLNYILPDTKSSTSTINLADDNGKVTLLVFGTSTCSSCSEEADALASALTDGKNPTQINLISVLCAILL